MDSTIKQISITSMNCRGVIGSCLCVDHLMKSCKILCLQEHHLFDDNKHFMSSINGDFEHYTVCASHLADDGRRIRQGGVSILWSKTLEFSVKPLPDIANNIQAVQVSPSSGTTLFIFNVYLPSANHGYSHFEDSIQTLNDMYQYYSQSGSVIICGDFNCSVSSGVRSLPSDNADPRRTALLHRIMKDNNQVSLVTIDICEGPLMTYNPYNGGTGTQIDHILIDHDQVRDHVVHAFVHDDHALNTSDHVPISVIINVSLTAYDIKTRSVYRWDKADRTKYGELLDNYLDACGVRTYSIRCDSDIDNLCDTLTKCMIEISDMVVPKSKYCSHKKPYWTTELGVMHKHQKQLRRTWISEGRPRGVCYPSYVSYKQAKHVFAKTLKFSVSQYEQQQFHDISLSRDLNIAQFWKYIRGQRQQRVGLNVICDEQGTYETPDDQLKMWLKHFQSILNESTDEASMYDSDFKGYIESEVQRLKNDMNKHDNPNLVSLSDFTMDEVKTICSSLPIGKAPGVDSITYEHFKYAGPLFVYILTKLFNGILCRVHIPAQFKEGLLITIYKGHGKAKDNKNSYRGVTLLPVINKVFEKCIMTRLQPHLDDIAFPPPLQHACRKGINNVMVSFAANESIYKHTEKGGKVFACLLDMEKCFDKLWWSGLLYKMHRIGIDNKLWHLMYDWLVDSNCRVYLNGQMSDKFTITRSIKQGGILSMLNLCIYMHDIHAYIDEYFNHGLYCDDLYVGSLCYADDVMLMSPSKYGLDHMMHKVWDYSCKWRFTFSPSKTKCMVFGENKRTNRRNTNNRTFNLGDQVIDEVTHYNHLGVTLCSYDSSEERTINACSKGNRSLASLNACGTSHTKLYPYVSSFLWNRICIPSMLHGCELWYEMRRYEVDMLERTQCRSLRGVQGLPPRTHNVITRDLLGELSMQSRIYQMKLSFLYRLVNLNPSLLVKRIFLQRLYEHLTNSKMKGFIPDIMQILEQCNISHSLTVYMCGGTFPSKLEWKQTSKQAVMVYDFEQSMNALCRKNDCSRYVRSMLVDDHSCIHSLYRIMQRSHTTQYDQALLTMIRILALPERSYSDVPCKLCKKEYQDIACHVIAECPALFQERNILWDYILDTLDVSKSVALSCIDDKQFTDFVFGISLQCFQDTDTDTMDNFYCNVFGIIQEHFYCGFKSNYEWFH